MRPVQRPGYGQTGRTSQKGPEALASVFVKGLVSVRIMIYGHSINRSGPRLQATGYRRVTILKGPLGRTGSVRQIPKFHSNEQSRDLQVSSAPSVQKGMQPGLRLSSDWE
ncbi:unnamed protein product, partial [Polarella glacialis]